jgi:hypothetical protein
MPASSSDVKLEIGHVLLIDIVDYSKLLITEQSEQIQKLREIVRGTEQFRLRQERRQTPRFADWRWRGAGVSQQPRSASARFRSAMCARAAARSARVNVCGSTGFTRCQPGVKRHRIAWLEPRKELEI